VPRRASLLREKRSASRLHTSLVCQVKWGETCCPGHLLSLSVEGALIVSPCNPPVGDHLSIGLELPWLKKSVSVCGEVVRTCPAGSIMHEGMHECGVHWNEVTPEARLLMDLVTTRDKLGVRPFRLVASGK
jgi:hypothetical protein